MKGFFQPTATSKKHEPLIPRCGACNLFKHCISPKMSVTGKGERGILFLGEAPGFDEDKQNKQFVGKAGQTLRSTLRQFDIDLDRDCWKTNSIICRPSENKTPTSDEIDHCRPNLTATIKKLKPRIIIPLGAVAVKSLLGPLWKEDPGPITKWVGWQIPLQKYNAWICPTYHPSYINRSESDREGPVLKLWFNRHIGSAMALEGRPWNKIPDYINDVKIIYDSNEAAELIKKVQDSGKAFAWDLETEGLKPDRKDFHIVSCAISTGNLTFAYLWDGAAIDATKNLLESDNPKIGFNAKFEHRWIKTKLGIDVKNWVWDGMLAAHLLDNRRGICSLKITSFLLLGQEPYDEIISPYFKSETPDGKNRIHEIDTKTLLIYNSMDALLTYLIAKKQRKEMKK